MWVRRPHVKREGCVFGFLRPETRFQKSAFSGSVWKISQTDAIHERFCKRALSSGRGLSASPYQTVTRNFHAVVHEVSLKQNMLHSRYSLWVFTSAVSLSVLFPRDLTFPIIIAGTAGLNLLLLSLRLAPDLQPRRLLRNSCRASGLSPGSSTGLHSAISCSRV